MSFDPSFQGTKNYIADRDGTKIGKWVTYSDAAQTNPVDGAGGSPASTFAVSTDSTMRGVTNFLWTHSAANRQGEGFSYDIAIDPSDKGKVLQCSFEYLISSGTYSDNDMSVWIYDVTNATLIQPAPYLIKNSGIIEKFAVEFQTASNSTSYRLIFHVDTATATAYTIRFTNFNLGPQAKLYGSAITDPVAYTPTFTGLGTVTGINFVSWREGANLLVKGTFTTGTPTATEARISLGFGGGNSNVTALSTLPTLSTAGTIEVTNFSSTVYKISALIEPSVGYITMGNQASTVGGLSKQNGNALFGASVTVSLLLKIPIQGWSSSQVFSSDADVRVVIFSGYVASNQALTANVTNLPLTASKDSHAAWTGSTYVVPVPGDYQIAATLLANATGGTMQAYVNAAAVKQMMTINTTEYVSSALTLENLKAGDIISLRSNATQTVAGVSTAFVSISRISGPSQIAASESVSALYTGAPPTGTLGAAFNIITYGTKVKDSHNAYSGGSYTVPASGSYLIGASTAIAGTFSASASVIMSIFIDGVEKNRTESDTYSTSVGTSFTYATPYIVPLLAGQVVTIRSYASGITSPTFLSSGLYHTFSITKVGNY